MIDVPRDDSGNANPSWRFMAHTRLVFIRCPNGHVARCDHEIAKDGAVSPSLVCPHPGCGFHRYVRLLDYA